MKKILLTATAFSLIAGAAYAQNLEKGIQYYNYERYQSAQKELQPLAASNPEANYYLGLAQIGQEDYNGAKATFGKDPSNFYNEAGMARIYFIQNQPAEAKKLLNDIVDHARKKDWEKYKVAADAITYTKGGDIQNALAWYQKAMEKEENNAMLLIGLGDAYLKMQSGGGESMTNYESAVSAGTHNSLAYSRIGYLWYAAQNYKLALESYNKAKEADTSNPLPYRDLANAYQRAGNYENALKNDELYLKKSDKSINDQIQYANILFLAKKYPEAQSKMEELISGGHERPYMYRIIGYSAYETKDYPKAYQNMQIFFKKEQDTSKLIPQDYLYMGKIYSALAAQDSLKQQVYADSAEKAYLHAVAMDTTQNKGKIYHDIADGYKDAKLYAKAGEWYGKIVAADTNAPALDYYYWGFWSYYGHEYDVAEKAFTAMKTKYPKEGSALYWLARVEAAKDSKAETGIAVQPYKDWLAFEAEGYTKEDQQLMYAYQYLAYYYYNQKNQTECLKWANKILEKDTTNKFAQSLKDYFTSQKKNAQAAADSSSKG